MNPTYHNSEKVLLQGVFSSNRVVTNHEASPTTFKAGLAVRRATSGAMSLSSGSLIGVSLGKAMHSSSEDQIAVCRKGNKVPIRVKNRFASGVITISNYANLVDTGDDIITVGPVAFVAQSGAATPGDATFQAASSNGETATSLAAQINAHDDTKELVTATVFDTNKIKITANEAGDDGEEILLEYSDEGTETTGATVTGEGTLTGGGPDFVSIGEIVYVDDTTGEACSSDDENAVATNAMYLTEEKIGVAEDGELVPCALINMVGGL